ncbi:MAG: hypothetical protein JXK94_06300 [Deltaproteobacteria bacterium]|nr:hypothetical protein [Deltaproteobacteria bacterium]
MKATGHAIKKLAAVFFILMLTQVAACAGKDLPSRHGPGFHGPPPEAFEACKGKKEGDKVTIKTSPGDEITATCQRIPEQLLAVPDGPPPGKHGKERLQD